MLVVAISLVQDSSIPLRSPHAEHFVGRLEAESTSSKAKQVDLTANSVGILLFLNQWWNVS